MLSPELAILLRQAILYQFRHRPDLLASRMRVCGVDQTLTPFDYLMLIGSCARTAMPVVWSMDLWNAALRDADKVFPECRISLESMSGVPGNQLWLFKGVHIAEMDKMDFGFSDGRKMALDAILVRVAKEGMDVTYFFYPFDSDDDDPYGERSYYIRSFGIIREGERIDAQYSSVCAALYFLGLRLTDMGPYRLHNKGQMKRIRKEVGDIPDLRVVTLRKREPTYEGDSRAVDWQHRWIVAGHWRRQWFPAARDHRPVYIQPYLKGPEDRPLLGPREAIYRAIR